MNIIQLFDMTLKGRAGEEALEWQGRTYTFGELDERSGRMAACLAGRGLVKGERLGIYLANCVEYVDLYLACLKLGVICVPVNILYRERELRHIEQDAAPVAIVAAGEVAGLQRCWLLEELVAEAHLATGPRPAVFVDGDDAATIIYTSGTTGVAKGAVLTHNNWAANAVNLITAWQITAADRLLLALPLFHVHGLGNGLHCWLIIGFRLRLLERFEGAKAAGEFLEFQPTLFFGVPTMYVRLMEIAPELADQIGRGVRLFVCGSAPLPAQLMEEFRSRFGSVILERYGMTETLMNISNPYAGERRPGSVGLPLPGVSVKIVDGELYVKGPNVFARYWGRREAAVEATQAAFVDGWFRTGDLGSMAEDGYYTLQGRKSDLIISSGFNVYPREIEEFLLELEGVREVAVAARPDPVKGEIAVAFVVGDDDLDVSVLEERCRASLASFKVPKRFVKVNALPRNALGKVQKHLLEA